MWKWSKLEVLFSSIFCTKHYHGIPLVTDQNTYKAVTIPTAHSVFEDFPALKIDPQAVALVARSEIISSTSLGCRQLS